VKPRIAILLLAAMAALLPACASNPLKAADGPDEKAYAVLGSYAIYQRQALKIKADTSLPASVRDAVVKADAAAYPILRTLDASLSSFLDAKAALDAGTTTKEKLAIALANLKKWTEEAKAAVATLKVAAANAKKTFAYSPTTPSHLAWSA
jgi:hypothetical protein